MGAGLALGCQMEKEPRAWPSPWLIRPPAAPLHGPCLLESPHTSSRRCPWPFPKWKELWLNIPEPSGHQRSIQQRGAGEGQQGVMKSRLDRKARGVRGEGVASFHP